MAATMLLAAQLSSLSSDLMRHGSAPSAGAGTLAPLRIMPFGDSITVFECAMNGCKDPDTLGTMATTTAPRWAPPTVPPTTHGDPPS